MNSLNTRQYTAIVTVQCIILLFDICVNSFASFARQHPTDLLVLYVYVIIFIAFLHFVEYWLKLLSLQDSRFLSYRRPHVTFGKLLFYLHLPGARIPSEIAHFIIF